MIRIRRVNILSIENLEKTVKDEPLFSGVTLGLDKGEKVGIVGKNGSGKSTFLRVIKGLIPADEGIVSYRTGTRVSFLEQNVEYREDATILDYFFEEKDERIDTLKHYQRALERGDNKESDKLLEIIEQDNLWDLERSFFSFITELGESFTGDEKMKSLSGGEQKKIALARALYMKSDLLLLDEPTNHLDIPSIEYLETWIKNTPSSVIIVTHDRHILNACCTTIWELDRAVFYRHPGSFSSYLERKEERLLMGEKENKRKETILRRELKWLMRGPQARTGKDKNRKERIEKMEDSLYKVREAKPTSFVSDERRLGKKILDIENITKSYEGRTLFSHFSFSFVKGQKIGLIGANGTGKSTFLDIISGQIEPDSGTIDKGVNTVFGYYDQLGRNLQSEKTILAYAESFGDRILWNDENLSASRFLEIFGFPLSSQRLPISTLSGGEKRRLYLITRLLSNPNFLLFDEPTNDLDIETMEKLEEYIASFSGCAIISSHDRTFLDCSVDMLFVIKDSTITLFPGNYTEWKESQEEEEKPKEVKKEKAPIREREKKGLSYKEQREKESLEIEIANNEELIKRLEDSFSISTPTELGTLQERTKKYNEIKDRNETITDRWLELAEKEEES